MIKSLIAIAVMILSLSLSGQGITYNPITKKLDLVGSGVVFASPFFTVGTTTYGPIWPMTAPVLGNYTWVNQNTATATSLAGGAIEFTSQNAASTNLNGLFKTAPATPYTVKVALQLNLQTPFNAPRCGLGFRESGTGKITGIGSRTPSEISYVSWASATSYSSDINNTNIYYMNGVIIWLTIRNDGTNLYYSYGPTPNATRQLYTQAKNAFFTTAPDQVGFFCDSNNSGFAQFLTLYSWLES